MPLRPMLCLIALCALAACDKAPETGSAQDKSHEGEMARKAVADVDAAQAAANATPAK